MPYNAVPMNQRQKQLRLDALDIVQRWGEGHSGRVLSCIDLLEGLYFGEEAGRPLFAHNPQMPQWEERDLFVLSKIEAMPALYATLSMAGYQLPELLPTLPDRHVPGIDVTVRKQAYGLAYAVGLAQGIQMTRQNRHVFCLMGEYEFRHGQAWEAVMTAAEQKLDRLCVILDENAVPAPPVLERFESFGWKVIRLKDAHDHDEIVYGYMRARVTLRKPTLVWAPTVKSAGVPFAEHKAEYDDAIYSPAEFSEARKVLI